MTIQAKEKTPVMVNGLPGKMATLVAKSIQDSPDFSLFHEALTGGKKGGTAIDIRGQRVYLNDPGSRIHFAASPEFTRNDGLVVDFTVPDAVLPNGLYYISKGWNFVMGTTGGDRVSLESALGESQVSAVIATNMAKEIVGLQNVLENFAVEHSGSLSGCTIRLRESHQGPDPARPEFKGKKDPSGTAITFSKAFGRMGIQNCPFTAEYIKNHVETYGPRMFLIIRDRKVQTEVLHVPVQHLDGHGYHTYYINEAQQCKGHNLLYHAVREFMASSPVFNGYSKVEHDTAKEGCSVERTSPDGNIFFKTELGFDSQSASAVLQLSITHNVNGRDIYASGTLEALRFLRGRMEGGRMFSMVDVISQ